MDALLPLFEDAKFEPLREGAMLAAAIAHASVELLRRRVQDAIPWLEEADRLARALRREADLQRVQAMRGLVAATQGDAQAVPLMREAIDLATLGGRAHLAAEARPLVAALVGDVTVTVVDRTTDDAASSRLLTAKEGLVLRLLDQGLSNKSIARELDVSGETVKWHLKNLFAKLSATTRTQAVSRARMLGLLGN
jgi:LuxR family maltose regulon positive regulatory protein